MTELKTSDTLLAALRNNSTRSLSSQELHDQRVSFILGSLKETSHVTRARVDEVLAHQGGRVSR